MSTRTVIEINHDYLGKLTEPDSDAHGQLHRVLNALKSSFITGMLNHGPVEQGCGITVLAQRHHSEPVLFCPRGPAGLTAKQAAVLEFMREFLAANDSMPSDRTIADRFGWSSVNSAFEHLHALHRKGCIERNDQGGWRFVRARSADAKP